MSLPTNQIIIGSLINASAVVFSAFLATIVSPWIQSKWDDKRWEREKLYDLHTNTYEALTELLKSIASMNAIPSYNLFKEAYASIGALGRLKLAYSQKRSAEIELIEQGLEKLFKGNSFRQDEMINELEEMRHKVLNIAQNDKRLKDLFKR